jgi:hypothetical protein
MLKAVQEHQLEPNHQNLKDMIELVEGNAPKIQQINDKTVIACGGDSRFAELTQNLDKEKDVAEQILERLRQKPKQKAFWVCRIAEYGSLKTILYENGEIKTETHTNEMIGFDSFAPEIKEVFFKKYVMDFYLATTEEKIKIIHEFFKEITTLFDGLAGGIPQIALINENGFQWITTQNFTGYSLNWMPEKIETISTTEIAWSSPDTWTDILNLTFECESTMLCIIFADARARIYKDSGTAESASWFKLLLDDNQISGTFGWIGKVPLAAGEDLRGNYSIHSVAIPTKGSHTIKMQMKAGIVSGSTSYAYDRRLSVLKGFYQGGTT